MASTSHHPIRVRTLEILWHGCERGDEAVQLGLQSVAIEGIVSIDYNRHCDRIVTCGGDGYIRLWQLHPAATNSWLANSQSDMTACVRFVSGMRTSWMPLTARWSPHGNLIASAHCDGKICLWWRARREDGDCGGKGEGGEEEEEWKDYRHLSGHVIDVYDLGFSPDSRYLISAGGDGSVVIHDLEGPTVPLAQLTEVHHKFCRGVAWDPWSRYVASFGGGPPLLFFTHTPRTSATSRRVQFAGQRKAAGDYIGESCATTFRRFGWSPDGLLVAVPYGKVAQHCHTNNNTSSSDTRRVDDMIHCIYLYTRNALDKVAGRLTIRGYSEIRGVLWAPCFLEPLDDDKDGGDNNTNNDDDMEMMMKKENKEENEGEGEKILLAEEEEIEKAKQKESLQRRRSALLNRGSWGPDDYRMALAVWTADAVVVYTTDSAVRHSDYTDMHMRSIADVAWSHDAKYLFTASLDGYITVIATGDSLGPAHRLPLFSARPATRALCTLLAEMSRVGENTEQRRGTVEKLSSSSSGGGEGTMQHAPVKKKRKVAEQPKEGKEQEEVRGEKILFSELAALMENV